MANLSILALFTSFIPGFREVDGGDCKALATTLLSSQNGIVAGAGGGLALAFQLTAVKNEVKTVATNGDSVALPPAIPGLEVFINNTGGHTLAVFGNAANQNNAGAADTVAPSGTSVQAASQNQSTNVPAFYVCTTLGQWKQLLSA